MALEYAIRSRWVSGVKAAARQISRIRCGSVSDLRRVRAARDLSLEENGALESVFKMEAEE